MAISDNLNSIRTHLEDDYTALEQLGVSVEDRNIENIKDMANQIYAKFPKTSYAEGSDITLSNTLKGKLDYENEIVGYGDVSQDSATGSNLMNTEKIVNGTYNGLTITKDSDDFINISGTATANTSIVLSEITYNFPSTLYISYENTFTTNTAQLSFLNGSTTLGGLTFSGANRTYDMSTILGGKTCTKIELYITSGNTINGKFRPMLNTQSGQTYSKYAFPNPSYPQDIEVVRGKNRVDWANINYTAQNGATITRTGSEYSVTSAGQYAFAQFSQEDLKLKPNTNYVFRAKIKSTETNNGSVIRVNPLMTVTGSEIYSSRTTSGNIAKIAFTTPSTIPSNAAVGLYPFEDSKTTVFTDIMICEGTDVNTSYLPYNTLEVVERGKNLAKEVKIAEVTTAYNGVMYLDIENDLQSNTTYTLSFIGKNGYKVYLNENITTAQWVTCNGNKQSLTFTTSGNIDKTNSGQYSTNVGGWVIFKNQTGNTETATFTEVMLETSQTATDYEPYQTPQTYQLSLGEYEFAKIGNYVDTIEYDVDEDKVYKKARIGKIVLNGTETWTKGETEQYRRFSTSNISTLKQTTGRIECLSNYFKYDYSATGHNVGTIFTYWTENGSIFLYPETTITTAEQLKTWLSTHNTIVYFILETPTLTEITGTLKDQIKALYYSHSFTGTTIIEINGQLPMIIKVRALKGE